MVGVLRLLIWHVNLRSCMHACMYQVGSFLRQSVHLSQKWDYDQLHSNYGKVLRI